MPSRLYSFFVYLGIFAIIVATVLFIAYKVNAVPVPLSDTAATVQTASANEALASTTSTATIVVAASTSTNTEASPATSSPTAIKPAAKASVTKTTTPIAAATTPAPPSQSSPAQSGTPQVARVQDPYNVPAESFTTVNTDARDALVNILCMPRGGGSLAPISGSGVIIDPRGVILTNSHVAQYVLLSEDANVNLSCQIRTGDPASAKWTAQVLYMPPVWVNAHVAEINTEHPTGTGEHDYALLLINAAVQGQNLPTVFPYLPYDTREAIGFLGDQVLGASYPAEFLGGIAAENSLAPVSSISPIDQLLTFSSTTVDVISIGGVVEAQSGSSGGPVVNQWGYLIGIIATTSDAPTTAGRDLRAITMSYIDRDIEVQTGSSLSDFLSGDLSAKEENFSENVAPGLLKQYIAVLSQ
jgi:hypothetical protein